MKLPRLTKEGVLLMAETLQEIQPNEPPIVVCLTRRSTDSNECIVSDGTWHATCHLFPNPRVVLASTTSAIIQVNEYVTSRESSRLYLGLVRVTLLTTDTRKIARKAKRYIPSAPTRVQGGRFPYFLQDLAPSLDLETLAGCSLLDPSRLRQLDEFVQRHAAMKTLHDCPDTRNVHSETYMKALDLFQVSQVDRQNASLTTNAGKQENAEKAKTLQKQHSDALKEAFNPQQQLMTPQTLQNWHEIMLNGILNQAGKWRTKGVKVGQVNFMPHRNVPGDMEVVCQYLRSFDSDFNVSSSSSNSPCLIKLVKAAFALFGIVDVHPFADGNGRLSRIAANWALGLPFCIHFFATQTQRAELIQAISTTRRNTSLLVRGVGGNSPGDHERRTLLATALKHVGCLQPLVAFIMDRVAKAIDEFQRVLIDQTRMATERQEMLQQRRFREEAMKSNCLVCFEADCNIATLCCGKAVHLNCMAEWLSQGNANCPQCRAQLPNLPPRLQRPSSNDEPSIDGLDDEDDMESTTDDLNSTFSTDDGDMEDEDDETIVAFAEHDATAEDANLRVAQALAQHFAESTGDEGFNSSTSTTDMEQDSQEGSSNTATATTSNDATATADDSTEGAPQEQPPMCEHHDCRNRAARDCSNLHCGRCCLLFGEYDCERHTPSN